MTTPAIEMAVDYLSTWTGSGPSWCAESWERGSTTDPHVPCSSERLAIAKRGGVIEPSLGNGVGQFRKWFPKRGPSVVAIPFRRMNTDAAGALSYGGLRGPAFDLLLVYACEDVSRWPAVRRFLLTRWKGKPALLDHAMASLMRPMKRNRAGDLAALVKMRKGDYLRDLKRGEAMIRTLLEDAAERFVRGLNGNPGFPENG